MAEYLVELGIDSMSLNPDTVLKTTQLVADMEARLALTKESDEPLAVGSEELIRPTIGV
jgi:hypothetical protein